ncbi:hypothetical protein FDP41_001217 [Naegleria fowleri]|uniref:F-box domain-containing protein n=1 Tax=Naegleria fowleri TaxID=5763 RepID=A0A6A5C0F5_NAEFO|nr:uncharacterized protein FDP41_001217 [Naegleria fowleri]KAF0980064.1 hypothetical protein FDP41_001217 [Naegleria fowleri]
MALFQRFFSVSASSKKDAQQDLHSLIKSSHIFKEIPVELFAYIASYFELDELFNMGFCDQYLLKLLFNLTPQKVTNLINQKRKLQNIKKLKYESNHFNKPMALEEKVASLWKEADLNLEVTKDDFDMIQTRVWKPLVHYYFPLFDMNLNIQNWMQVIRIRVTRLRKYSHLTLSSISIEPINEKNEIVPADIESYYETPFIENCDLVYECPVVSELFTGSKYADTVYCEKCNKSVQFIQSLSEFKSLIGKEQCVAFRRYDNEFYGGLM